MNQTDKRQKLVRIILLSIAAVVLVLIMIKLVGISPLMGVEPENIQAADIPPKQEMQGDVIDTEASEMDTLSSLDGAPELKAQDVDKPVSHKPQVRPQNRQVSSTETSQFPVYICGAVQKPSVVLAQAGEYLEHLINRCGGLTQQADRTGINLAMSVRPHMMVFVPKKGEKAQVQVGSEYLETFRENRGTKNGKQTINLNQANEETLRKIPGIGSALAQEIIRYREKVGRFNQVSDLMKVPGIKQAKFNQIKDKVHVAAAEVS